MSETKVEEKKARKSNEPEEHGEDRQEENNDGGLHQNDRVAIMKKMNRTPGMLAQNSLMKRKYKK